MVVELDLMTFTIKVKNGKRTIKGGEIVLPIPEKKWTFEYEIYDAENYQHIYFLNIMTVYFSLIVNKNFISNLKSTVRYKKVQI